MIFSLARLLRPHQWTKNGVCLAGVIFGGRFDDPRCWLLAAATILVFCLVSSAVYIWNDIQDRERDRDHPRKCDRPIASGAVSVPLAALFSLFLAGTSLGGGFLLGPAVLTCVCLYLANNVCYTLWFKHFALLDVLCITLGFILRLLAGVYVLGDLPNAWIVLCSFFLSAFLGFSKRRAELMAMESGNQESEAKRRQRPVLAEYSVDYLDFLLSSSATMTIMSYALFATTSGKNPSLIVTLPIVYYAVMHYKRLVMVSQIGEEPERILFEDWRIIVSILSWLVLYLFIWRWEIHIIR